jgi:hypothetical protein
MRRNRRRKLQELIRRVLTEKLAPPQGWGGLCAG